MRKPTLQEVKDRYLDFVMLSKEEHAKLVERFGKSQTEEKIETLNEYLGSKGKKYKSHYFTILVWARRKSERKKQRLWPISGKVCGEKGCKMPAVYKSTGAFDNYFCSDHMPAKVKAKYA